MKNSLPHFCRNRGSIAILTLWAVLFIALLSLALSSQVSGRLLVASEVKWSPKVRALGTRALADALTLISEDRTADYDSLREPWASDAARFKDVPYGGATYTLISEEGDPSAEEGPSRYGLSDEERKINLNRSPAAVLSRLLRNEGELSEHAANELAGFIVDWRDENGVKEGGGGTGSEDCASLPLPARCKNADFEALEELLWIPGMTVPLFQQVKDDLTLYGAGPCNINTATVSSLRAVGLSEEGALKIVAWREAGNVFENVSWITGRSGEFGLGGSDPSNLQAAAASGLLGIKSDAYRGLVQAEFGGRVKGRIGFIIERGGKVKSWQE